MRKRIVAAIAALLLMAPVTWAEKPALVVYIVVDQLRGDIPLRYQDRFGDGGFRRFLEHGTVYTDAHYRHAITFTGCGHATLGTGGNPREHGIIANDWTDPATGKNVYCSEDQAHKLLGAQTGEHTGTSPKNLQVPTLAESLVDASNGRSRVFGVSGKDRGATLMAGAKGKAFWFSNETGGFVTSDYYYAEYPAWVTAFNTPPPADQYTGKVWDLVRPANEYKNADERPTELANPIIGGVFPHSFEGLDSRKLYSVMSVTPFSDDMTIHFAKAIVENEKLGQGPAIDMLTVSLSATDIIGHQFGPESREHEDQILRLDAQLASFFAFLDEKVGAGKYLAALSADHGVDGNPEEKPSGQTNPADMVKAVKDALKAKYGDTEEYVQTFTAPYIVFTPALVEVRPADIPAMEDLAAEALRNVPGVAYAIPAHKIVAGELDAENPIMDSIARSFHPGRSGNVYVVQEAYHRFFSGKPTFTATHGSPYPYDTHVPVYFYGTGIPAKSSHERVGPENIVPTLATLLGIPIPSGAKEAPLAVAP